MSTARNSITGALLKTKPATNSYRDGYDAIFGKKESNFDIVKKALFRVSLDEYIQLESDDKIYLRIDTGDDIKENESYFYNVIADDLQEVGYEVDDVCIEHDCITGYIIPKKA